MNKKSLFFGLFTTFITGIGFTIILPVVPFMVSPFVSGGNRGLVVSALVSVYALCTFFAAPAFGVLSDRFGRKPILLVSLIGSAIGFLIFGWATALWLLFLGRMVDGLTGGNVVALLAYFSDITSKEERTKVFGWMSATVGIGTITGPAIGGLLATFGKALPFEIAALLTLVNFAFGVFVMKESLPAEKRLKQLSVRDLNPFRQLRLIFQIRTLARLLFLGMLIWLPANMLQALMSQLSLDSFSWSAVIIGLVFSIMGLQDIVTQSLILPFLLKKYQLTDRTLLRIAIVFELIGYIAMAAGVFAKAGIPFVLAVFIYAFGDSVFGTAFNGKLSKSISDEEQGRVQGGSQALQSLAKIFGPLAGGFVYVSFGHAVPVLFGALLLLVACVFVFREKV